jgi:UPF0271 protein
MDEMSSIDLNCDCGESFGSWVLGDDDALLRAVTSANIACGGHAGDPQVMRSTVRLARDRGVAVGAHPGYPDLQGFGRRQLALSAEEIENSVLAQIGALAAICRAEGVRLRHVKAHGALYNAAAHDFALAEAIARAVVAYDPSLILVGLAGSALLDAGRAAGLRVAGEAFADRAYEADGSLRARALPGALIHEPKQCLAQALAIVQGHLTSHDGAPIAVDATTICIHGDSPGATERARFVRTGLEQAGIVVCAMTG